MKRRSVSLPIDLLAGILAVVATAAVVAQTPKQVSKGLRAWR